MNFNIHRERIAEDLKNWFEMVRDTANPECYPIEINTVLANAPAPINMGSISKLPAVFFKYGQSRPNDNIRKPNTHRGETIDYAIFAVISENKDNKEGLLIQSAKMHSLIEMFVKSNQQLGNPTDDSSEGYYKLSRTREVRLGPSRAYGFRKVSDRGFIEFHIEIDHIYPIMRT